MKPLGRLRHKKSGKEVAWLGLLFYSVAGQTVTIQTLLNAGKNKIAPCIRTVDQHLHVLLYKPMIRAGMARLWCTLTKCESSRLTQKGVKIKRQK